MNNKKFIGVWTCGLASKPSAVREKIETAFNKAAREKDDWFYKIVIDGNSYFVADNGQFGYTAMLAEEY